MSCGKIWNTKFEGSNPKHLNDNENTLHFFLNFLKIILKVSMFLGKSSLFSKLHIFNFIASF